MDMTPNDISRSDHRISVSNNENENEFIDTNMETPTNVEHNIDDFEQRKRRASIRAIMSDKSTSQIEKSKMVQGLMDGRRRGSLVSDYNSECTRCDPFHLSEGNSLQEQNESSERNRSPLEVFESTGLALSTECSSSTSSRRQYKRSYSSFMSECSDMDIDDASFSRSPLEISCMECTHYDRKCNIVAPCCGMISGCRFCHDESEELPPRIDLPSCADNSCKSCTTIPSKMAAVSFKEEPDNSVETEKTLCTFISAQTHQTHHNIDRFAITEVICKECNTRQSSKT